MILPNIGMPGFPPPQRPAVDRAARLEEMTVGLCLNRRALSLATANTSVRNHRLALDAVLDHEWRALFKGPN